ncbi:hypothetical protein SNEBB_002734 [Seison nebaliae]|nr:hypothetical protein SNEBB_002734 [Seison nebaliae]
MQCYVERKIDDQCSILPVRKSILIKHGVEGTLFSANQNDATNIKHYINSLNIDPGYSLNLVDRSFVEQELYEVYNNDDEIEMSLKKDIRDSIIVYGGKMGGIFQSFSHQNVWEETKTNNQQYHWYKKANSRDDSLYYICLIGCPCQYNPGELIIYLAGTNSDFEACNRFTKMKEVKWYYIYYMENQLTNIPCNRSYSHQSIINDNYGIQFFRDKSLFKLKSDAKNFVMYFSKDEVLDILDNLGTDFPNWSENIIEGKVVNFELSDAISILKVENKGNNMFCIFHHSIRAVQCEISGNVQMDLSFNGELECIG